VAQGVGPEFKLQYHKTTTTTTKSGQEWDLLKKKKKTKEELDLLTLSGTVDIVTSQACNLRSPGLVLKQAQHLV
jgi:hypothetical protein